MTTERSGDSRVGMFAAEAHAVSEALAYLEAMPDALATTTYVAAGEIELWDDTPELVATLWFDGEFDSWRVIPRDL